MTIKVGLILPARPTNHLAITDPMQSIGCLNQTLRDEIVQRLVNNSNLDIHTDIDLSQSIIINGEVWSNNICLNHLDVVLWYCEVDRDSGSYDLEVLKTLSRDVPVVRDPYKFEIALDKYTAHLCLRDSGVNTPDFALFDYRVPQRMEAILNDWGAAVLKPRRGGWGKGVTLINHAGVLRDIIGYLQNTTGEASTDGGFFLERYYDNDLSRWSSLTMINGDVVYGYRKLATKYADFGNGTKKILDENEKGGEVVLANLVDSHYQQAELAYKALNLGLVGFDMIWVDNQPMIIDENTSPGNYTNLFEQVGKDQATLFVDWLETEIKTAVA